MEPKYHHNTFHTKTRFLSIFSHDSSAYAVVMVYEAPLGARRSYVTGFADEGGLYEVTVEYELPLNWEPVLLPRGCSDG